MGGHKRIRGTVLLAAAMTFLAVFPTSVSAGWVQTADGRWRFENASAAGYAVGWDQLDGEWYYFDGQGIMQTGWIEDQGQWYYLDETGAMVRNRWVGGYYVNGSGVWVPGAEKGKKEITFSDFQTIREDIDGDGYEERFELSQGLTGVNLNVRLSYGSSWDISFEGVFQPECQITICDLGTGGGSLLAQVPTYGTDERYWVKCFLRQNGVYQEVQVPDYTYSGYFIDEYQYQLVCDNTDFKIKAECTRGEEHREGQLLRSGFPMRYQTVHDAAFNGYLLEIRQELYTDEGREDVIGAAVTRIGWKDGGWRVITQAVEG